VTAYLCAPTKYLNSTLRCPLVALSGRRWVADQCPFSGVKQTSQIYGAVSANDPRRTCGESLATNGSCLAGARSATHHREAVHFKFGDPEPSWTFPWSIH
jgi:hypothetical protein